MPPLLDGAQLADLRSRPPQKCSLCSQQTTANYCRECDEFFRQGHAPDCHMIAKPGELDNHAGHRTY